MAFLLEMYMLVVEDRHVGNRLRRNIIHQITNKSAILKDIMTTIFKKVGVCIRVGYNYAPLNSLPHIPQSGGGIWKEILEKMFF